MIKTSDLEKHGHQILLEEDADGGFDAVLVDAWGHVLDRAYGRDRLHAEAALREKLATAPTTTWL